MYSLFAFHGNYIYEKRLLLRFISKRFENVFSNYLISTTHDIQITSVDGIYPAYLILFRKKFSLKWYKICYCTTRIREIYLSQRLNPVSF